MNNNTSQKTPKLTPMNFPLYLKIEQKQTNKQNTSLRHVSDKEKCTALLKIGSISRKERKFYFVKVEEKDKFLGDFSLIWPFDVLNCNKQPLSVHWSSNMGCRSIARLRFNSNLNHSLLSLRKIYLWNHWAVIAKWNLCQVLFTSPATCCFNEKEHLFSILE